MLEVAGLRKRFGTQLVVDDLSLTVRGGEVLGIMGPNGAGKSSLFDLLSGVTRPDHGSILLAGKDISRLPPEGRSRAGLGRTFQVPRPFASLTVREHAHLAATHPAGLQGVRTEDIAEEVLDQTGLAAQADIPGGQLRLLDRKRLELARALATRPKVLLLDEVSGGLSDAEISIFVALIARLSQAGLAVLWIEHIAHVLGEICDRIMLMHLGRKIIEERPDVVMADPRVRSLYLGAAHRG